MPSKPRSVKPAEQWESVVDAARRLGRSPGHIRRLCAQQLKAQGKARLMPRAGQRSAWEVRGDVTLSGTAAPAGGQPAAILTVGLVSLVIDLPCTITLSAPPPTEGNETTNGPRLAGP